MDEISVSIIALCVSIISLLITVCIFVQSRILSIKPILVFAHGPTTTTENEGEENCWIVYNVGYGPALDILFAKRRNNQNDGDPQVWQEWLRLPSLAPNTYVTCPSGYDLCCDYHDIDDRCYTSLCRHRKTTVKEGTSLPFCSEEKITKKCLIPKSM